ncbi:MAG: STAS domain-containing protein [Aeromicrobium sp.]
MTRTETEDDGRTVVLAEGDVDLATAPMLREALGRVLQNPGSVVVDVGGVGFIDSSGLNALVWGHQQAQKSGGSLSLRRPSPMLCRLLEITALDSLLLIDDGDPGAGTET